MTRTEAINLLDGVSKDMTGPLGEAIHMATDALRNMQEEVCEACMVHYEDDGK